MYMVSLMTYIFSARGFGHPVFLKPQFGHPVMKILAKSLPGRQAKNQAVCKPSRLAASAQVGVIVSIDWLHWEVV